MNGLTSIYRGCSRCLGYLNPLVPLRAIVGVVNKIASVAFYYAFTYPCNLYLHARYKNHRFSPITNQNAYLKAKNLFDRCLNTRLFREPELTVMRTQLNEAYQALYGQPIVLPPALILPQPVIVRVQQPTAVVTTSSAPQGQTSVISAPSEPTTILPQPFQWVRRNRSEAGDVSDDTLSDYTELTYLSSREESDVEDGLVAEKNVTKVDMEKIEQILNEFPIQEGINSLKSLIASFEKPFLEQLQTLLTYEKAMQWKSETTAEDYRNYLEQLDNHFQVDWKKACQQAKKLHAQFKEKFKEVGQKGVFTKEQSDWILKKMKQRFKDLYEHAFDAPSRGIFQRKQIAHLFHLIGTGDDEAPLTNESVVLIEELEEKETPSKRLEMRQGSYLFSQFFEIHQLTLNEDLRSIVQLKKLLKTFITRWFTSPGTTLNLNGIKIISGLGSEDPAQWVEILRDQYVAYLQKCTAGELNAIIHQSMKCPFYKLLRRTHSQILAEETGSLLPAKVVKTLLNGVTTNPGYCSAIETMMEVSSFPDEAIIRDLARKAGCEESQIEPLIRIKALYVMLSLSQLLPRSMIQGVEARLKGIDISEKISLTEGIEEISLDRAFEKLTIHLGIKVKDAVRNQWIAEAHSMLKVSSLSGDLNGEAFIVELQNLRFTPSATWKQRMILASQVNPTLCLQELQNLAGKIAELKFADCVKEDKAHLAVHGADDDEQGEETKHIKQIVKMVEQLKCLTLITQKLYALKEISEDRFHAAEKISENAYFILGHVLIHLQSNAPTLSAPQQGELTESLTLLENLIATPPQRHDAEKGSIVIKEGGNLAFNLIRQGISYYAGGNQESSIKWQVRRYEDVIQKVHQELYNYLHVNTQLSSDFVSSLSPVLDIVNGLRTDQNRYTTDYLILVQQVFSRDLVGTIRTVATWAVQNTNDDNVKHLTKIYSVVTSSLEFLNRCRYVYQTFSSFVR